MAAPFSTPGLHCRPIDDRGVENPKVGFDYDGAIHQTDRRRFVHDIGRAEMIDRQGWIDIHVVAEHSKAFVLHRAREAFLRRGHPVPPISTRGR